MNANNVNMTPALLCGLQKRNEITYRVMISLRRLSGGSMTGFHVVV